jgi:6-phosphogluconolactonase
VTTWDNFAVTPNGKFLFSVSYDSSRPIGINNAVTVFAANATNGALTIVPGSPFAAGISAYSASVDPTGQFLYVVNQQADEQSSIEDGNISVYSIDASTGVLTPVAGSPFAAGTTPVYIAIR